jgi:hypothetical protein
MKGVKNNLANTSVKRNGLLVLKVIMDVCRGRADKLLGTEFKTIGEQVFYMAKEGKMLSLFCNFIDYFPIEFQPYLEKRCSLTDLYLKYLEIISEELNNEGVEYYIFKTIKPFAYDMTDIDILIIEKKDMLITSGILMKKLGFRVVSKGTYSLTFRKTINGFDIDIDLQSRISAGTFEYIFVSETKRIIGNIGYTKNGLSLLKPELELAIIAGHVFFKDLSVSLADLISADYLIKTADKKTLITILEHNKHMSTPFSMMYYLTNVFERIFSDDLQSYPSDKCSPKLILLARHSLNQLRECNGRIIIPIFLSIEIYLETLATLIEEHHYKQLLEIVEMPQSRGIKLFFRRLGFLSQEEAIRV